MVIAGGFHGSVSGDVLAYTLPNALSMKRNDKVCSLYGSQIRLVAGSRRKLLHSRADRTEGRERGRGVIGLSQILVAVKANPAISNDLVLIFVHSAGPVEWGFDILSS